MVKRSPQARQNISEGTSLAMDRLRRERRRASRYAPFGWDFAEDGRLVSNRREQLIRMTIRDLKERGWGYKRIAAKLNDNGVATKRGGKWHGSTVKSLLLVVDRMNAAMEKSE